VRDQKKKRSTRLIRSVGVLLVALAVVFLGMKLYTDWLVRRAETKYPPDKFVTVEGLQLHYVSKGSGRPVVFIAGRNGKVQDFTLSPLFEPVTENYRAIFIDRPGLGYSERPKDEAATFAVQARLIHGALMQLGIEKPVLVGQSRGGEVALEYALDYPDDVAGIVLLGSSPYQSETPADPIFDAIEGIVTTPVLGDFVLYTVYVPIARQVMSPFLEAYIEYFAPLDEVPSSYYDTSLELALRPTMVKADAEEEKVVTEGLEKLCTRLDEIAIPVVIVTGDLDTYAMEQVPRLENDVSNSKVIIVEDAHHFLWFSYPGEVIDAIGEAWMGTEEMGGS
jgi:pimeloyl-ACP methyl ester carboxylesterase